MMARLLISLLVVFAMGGAGQSAHGQGKTIVYVPFDDRPVSLDYVLTTFQLARCSVQTPPIAALASRGSVADTEALWSWLEEQAPYADRLVVSADALLYGGLVASRTHHDDREQILDRVERFGRLKADHPDLKVYVFSTIMRSPKLSAGNMEPPYYTEWGRQIFQATALEDKGEQQQLTTGEKQQLTELRKVLPPGVLEDWLERRNKNFIANNRLVELTQNGQIDYLLLGRDDTSPYSQSRRELRQLLRQADGLSLDRFATFPGADQLGMIMVTRAVNHMERQAPVVEVHYAGGIGAKKIPAYEDQPFGNTVVEHITAAGGVATRKTAKPDLVLAVNTPYQGITLEADHPANDEAITPQVWSFVQDIKKALDKGRRVAVADIAFANGSDNGLLRLLEEEKLLDKISAYSGWNTASNTLGYAIAQGMMAPRISEQGRKHLLAVHYLDEWAYQANARNRLSQNVIYAQGGDIQFLDQLTGPVTKEAERELRQFTRRHLWLREEAVHVSFPWNRMFEIHVTIDEAPRSEVAQQ